MPDLPDPLVQGAAAIYERLRTDPGLQQTATPVDGTDLAPGGVWEAKAVTDIPGFPVVMFMVQPIATDYRFGGPWRHRLSLMVTVADKAENVDAAAAAASRVYTLLQDQDDAIKATLALPDFDVLLCRRRLRNRQQTVVEGETYQQLVEQYDYQLRPA